MADNTEEEHLNNPTNIHSANHPDETEPTTDTETITTDQENVNMEVHHHPELHHKSKKWKEYLLEGFMIFIAVTMGFLAESYHVHLINKETEKQNIKSLIKSIAIDTVQLGLTIKANMKVVSHLDSLVLLRNADLSIEKNKRDFLARCYWLFRRLVFYKE